MLTKEAMATRPNSQLRGFEINSTPEKFDIKKDLPTGFLEFYLPLHQRFTPWQQKLVNKRKQVLAESLAGKRPNHLPPSEATTAKWQIELPEWCQDQRNQMTGPGDDAELVVKMLNSGAPGVMLDLEDSEANYWEHLELGIKNILTALKGELKYFDKKRNKEVAIQESKTVIFTRARGLHLAQRLGGLDAVSGKKKEDIPGYGPDLTSASLYDVCRVVFAVDAKSLKHPLSFYIPKSESADEALWWSALLKEVAKFKGWPEHTIKCMALVESHPIAFQMEEFLYNLREHLMGLNLGRWDYMASLIHFNLSDPNWVLPDRNTIPHDVKFFQNLRDLLVKICHSRGCLAIGGMTALYPDRTNPELNTRALAVLEKDKKNEADCGMDGAWTGHPDQNEIAVKQFPFPNQIKAYKVKDERYPELRPLPTDVGQKTLAGTRAAIRTVIRYRNGVLNGKGASLLDGYMEDLATDRIYRLMIAQRMKHRDQVQIVDETGKAVPHTPEVIHRLFDEELDKLLKELPADTPADVREKFRKARAIGGAMVVNGEFDPI
jgi:malate synthase